ncbi:MAG: DUF4199 domain-containing protein [Bacteroidales bacterium]|nr:DUF4199 domain-containing protein [Bacteroidales bacterium]
METHTPEEDTTGSENTLLRSTMTMGLITGLALIIYTLLLYATNNLLKQNFALGVVNYIILIAGIVIGTRSYRDQAMGGYITYGKALGYGVVLCVFTGIVVGIFTYLLYEVIDPSLMEQNMKVIQEEMLNRGMSAEQVETMTEMQARFRTPFMMLIGSIFTYSLLGLIFSLVTSAFLKKDKPMFND